MGMIYDAGEAARYLNISMAEVERLVENGELGGYLNGVVRITGDEIERYVRTNRTNAKGERTIREGGSR